MYVRFSVEQRNSTARSCSVIMAGVCIVNPNWSAQYPWLLQKLVARSTFKLKESNIVPVSVVRCHICPQVHVFLR